MLAALSELALKRPLIVLAGNLAVAAICAAFAVGAPGALGIGSTGIDDDAEGELVVLLEGEAPASSRVFAVARQVVAAQIAADPDLEAPRLVEGEEGARHVLLVAPFATASESNRADAIERIEERIDPGPLRVSLGGETAELAEARRSVGGDLWRLELLVLPLVLLLASMAARPRLLLAPVLAALTATAGSLAGMRLAGLAFDVSLLGAVPAAAVGVVLGIELAALVARVHRDEAALAPGPDAIRPTIEAAARPLAAAATSAALPALALLATPLESAGSLALGCALAAFLAAASALVAIPAAISLWGAGAWREEPGRVGTALRRVPSTLARRPIVTIAALALALVAGLALAVPALDATGRPLAAADLPAGSEPVRVAELGAGAVESASGSLFPELPLVAAIAAGLLGVAWLAATRAAGALPAALVALVPAAAGIGAAAFVFGEGHLTEAIDATPQVALDNAAVATALAALAAIGAARGAIALRSAREERRLGITPDGVAELTATLTYPGALAAGFAGLAMCAALVAADLYAAREFGIAVAFGLAVDLLILRIPSLAAIARWGYRTPRKRPKPEPDTEELEQIDSPA